jgi:hypothetical protein
MCVSSEPNPVSKDKIQECINICQKNLRHVSLREQYFVWWAIIKKCAESKNMRNETWKFLDGVFTENSGIYECSTLKYMCENLVLSYGYQAAARDHVQRCDFLVTITHVIVLRKQSFLSSGMIINRTW